MYFGWYIFVTVIQYQNEDIGMGTFGTIHRPYWDFTSLTCIPLCVCVCGSCGFITCVGWSTHHSSQDIGCSITTETPSASFHCHTHPSPLATTDVFSSIILSFYFIIFFLVKSHSVVWMDHSLFNPPEELFLKRLVCWHSHTTSTTTHSK